MTPATSPADEPSQFERRHFIESLGTALAGGRPRLQGRMLGWLLFGGEPLSQAQLSALLQASSGAVSTTLRDLERVGMVERITVPGDRTGYYRATDQPWLAALRSAIDETRRTAELVARGYEVFDEDDVEARQRLDELSAWFDEMLVLMPELLGKLSRTGLR